MSKRYRVIPLDSYDQVIADIKRDFDSAISRCERRQLTTGDVGSKHEVSYSWVIKSETLAHYMELTGTSKPTAYNHYDKVKSGYYEAKKGKLVFMREKEDPSQGPTATVSISSTEPVAKSIIHKAHCPHCNGLLEVNE